MAGYYTEILPHRYDWTKDIRMSCLEPYVVMRDEVDFRDKHVVWPYVDKEIALAVSKMRKWKNNNRQDNTVFVDPPHWIKVEVEQPELLVATSKYVLIASEPVKTFTCTYDKRKKDYLDSGIKDQKYRMIICEDFGKGNYHFLRRSLEYESRILNFDVNNN